MSRMEDASGRIFGSTKRLAVLSAIAQAPDDDLFADRIAEISRARSNQVGNDMKRLTEVGLLSEVPRRAGSRRVYYRREESVLWELCTGLFSELAD